MTRQEKAEELSDKLNDLRAEYGLDREDKLCIGLVPIRGSATAMNEAILRYYETEQTQLLPEIHNVTMVDRKLEAMKQMRIGNRTSK